MEATTSLIWLVALTTSQVGAKPISFELPGFGQEEASVQQDDMQEWEHILPRSEHETFVIPLKISASYFIETSVVETQKRVFSNGRSRTWRRQSKKICFGTKDNEICVEMNSKGTPTRQALPSRPKRTTLKLFAYVDPTRTRMTAPSQGISQDSLRDALWPSEARDTAEEETPSERLWLDALKELTSTNTTVRRKARWSHLMATTGLDSANNPNITAELNATLQMPVEESAKQQMEKDLLLLHRLIQHTGWSPDKKLKAYRKGLTSLIAAKNYRDTSSKNLTGKITTSGKCTARPETKFHEISNAQHRKGQWNGVKTRHLRRNVWDDTEGPSDEAETGAVQPEESKEWSERPSELRPQEHPEIYGEGNGDTERYKWEDTDEQFDKDRSGEVLSDESEERSERHFELRPQRDMSQERVPAIDGEGDVDTERYKWDDYKDITVAGQSEESEEWSERHSELRPQSDMSQEQPPEIYGEENVDTEWYKWDDTDEQLDKDRTGAVQSEESEEWSERHSELRPQSEMSQEEQQEQETGVADSDDWDADSNFQRKRVPAPGLVSGRPWEENKKLEEEKKYGHVLKWMKEGLKKFSDTMPRGPSPQPANEDYERDSDDRTWLNRAAWRPKEEHNVRERNTMRKSVDMGELLRPDDHKRILFTAHREVKEKGRQNSANGGRAQPVPARKLLNRVDVKHNGVSSNEPTVDSFQRQCFADASRDARSGQGNHTTQILERIMKTRNSLGVTPVRLSAFGDLVHYSYTEAEAAWNTLSLGFRLYANESRLTKDELSEVVRNMSVGLQEDGGYQETRNAMIIADLMAFNQSESTKMGIELLASKPPLEKASVLGKQALKCLYSRGRHSVRDVRSAYDNTLQELISAKLSLLEREGKHSAEVKEVLAKKPKGMATAMNVKRSSELNQSGNVSTATLLQGYDTALKKCPTLSLAFFTDEVSGFEDAVVSMRSLTSGITNNSAMVANATDKVLQKLTTVQQSDSNRHAINQLLFLKLLLIANSSVSEEPCKELLVAKWAIRAGGSAGLAASSFSSATAGVVKAFVNQGLSALSKTLEQELFEVKSTKPMMNSSEPAVGDARQLGLNTTESPASSRTTVANSTNSSMTTNSVKKAESSTAPTLSQAHEVKEAMADSTNSSMTTSSVKKTESSTAPTISQAHEAKETTQAAKPLSTGMP